MPIIYVLKQKYENNVCPCIKILLFKSGAHVKGHKTIHYMMMAGTDKMQLLIHTL